MNEEELSATPAAFHIPPFHPFLFPSHRQAPKPGSESWMPDINTGTNKGMREATIEKTPVRVQIPPHPGLQRKYLVLLYREWVAFSMEPRFVEVGEGIPGEVLSPAGEMSFPPKSHNKQAQRKLGWT